MTARVLTDEEYQRHLRIGVALGIPIDALRSEPRDLLIEMHAVTDLEPCESCGVRVFAVENDGRVSVVEPVGVPVREDDRWWHDVARHVCRTGGHSRAALAEQVMA